MTIEPLMARIMPLKRGPLFYLKDHRYLACLNLAQYSRGPLSI